MFTIYSLTIAVWCDILYIELRERNKRKTLTIKIFKVATLQQKGNEYYENLQSKRI
jgi:hypothetical protein